MNINEDSRYVITFIYSGATTMSSRLALYSKDEDGLKTQGSFSSQDDKATLDRRHYNSSRKGWKQGLCSMYLRPKTHNSPLRPGLRAASPRFSCQNALPPVTPFYEKPEILMARSAT